MTTPDLAYAIGLEPAAAVAYLEQKGYVLGFSWQDVWQQAHAKAFTAAGVMKADVLADLKAGLVDALKHGHTRQEFIDGLTPLLQKKGWWGTHAQTDPQTGEMHGKGLTPRRLGTIFDTNMQTAYMAGRYQAMLANVDDRPYWMYSAIMDRRTRPSHAALNGRVFRHDDPIWNSIFPPNGFRCRCSVRALDGDDLKARKLDLSSSQGALRDVEVPVSRKPGAPLVTVTRFEYAPGKAFMPDPGWNYNPGQSALRPFVPPPLDSLPRTFPVGVSLPQLPKPAPVSAARLLADGLPPQDYARAFLSVFGADIGKSVVFKDVAGAALVIDEALFQDGAGNWKSIKNFRGPYMKLLAEAVKEPDEIWLRWEESRDQPGAWRLKRRYIKSWQIDGPEGTQHGLSVFEHGKDGWTGSTAMMSQPERNPDARKRYIEKQRDGFLLYQK
ncbi:PBECR2 nuclease fold domain-containing protein [Chitinivorax sp. PXF-14]|uniref:PBECR2 nuclease fold domain-containing protein n=1 Tax=Chitinivorax sp. PXF-14 TaxID=3230488 RepID=UPI0034665988